MTWQSALLVLGLLTVLLVGRRVFRVMRRNRALRGLQLDRATKSARGVRVAGLLENLPAMKGLNPRRRNMMVGDLLLFDERFVLGTDRGRMADVGPESGNQFSSVRSPGPGRLIIEGRLPSPRGGDGLYRFEITVEEAGAWVRELQPFVEEQGRAEQLPPWA